MSEAAAVPSAEPSAEPSNAAEPEKTAEEEKIEQLANALEEVIAAHGEKHLKCAPAYVDYARALLAKAQSEGDLMGGALKKPEDEEGGAAASGGAADDDDGEDGEGEEGEEGEPESDDLELSFQCFEVARLIYEEAGAGHEQALADVLENLGEVAMENEMWEDAIGELEKSLALKRALLGADDRQLAHLHYQLATAALARSEKAKSDLESPPPASPDNPIAAAIAAQAAAEQGGSSTDAPPATPEELKAIMAEFLKRASEQYTLAANVLDASLTALKVKTGKPDEISDLEEMLKEVREKVEEVDGMAKAAEKAAEGSSSGSGSSTNGFDKPSVGGSTTTIGFGNGGGGGGGGGGTAAAFAPSTTNAVAKDLGVVGGKGKKRVRLE